MPPSAPPIEALIVDRDGLVRILRIALAELHQRRQITPHLTGHSDVVQQIRYWDTVFGWIKDLQDHEIVVMNRRPEA